MESLLGIIIPLVLIAISGHIIWKSTDAFEIAADFLGRNMSKGVKGATINAVASSMPEFFATMFFLFYVKDNTIFVDSFSGGIGVVAGSAVFNILVIPLAIIIFGVKSKGSSIFKVDKDVVIRDGLFLLVSNILLILIISMQILNPIHGLILIIIYLSYIILLRKGLGLKKSKKFEVSKYYVEEVDLKLLHFIRLELKQIMLNGKHLRPNNAWVVLCISIIFMSLGSWLLVLGTDLLGSEEYALLGLNNLKGLDLPLVFLSVLIASAATSIPDTIISVKDARKGNHDDSISNAIGSNIFDLSFVLGLPLLIYTVIHGPIEMSRDIRILSVSYWLFMLIINLIVIPVFIFSKNINRRIGFLLGLLYLLFVFYVVEGTSGKALFQWAATGLINIVN